MSIFGRLLGKQLKRPDPRKLSLAIGAFIRCRTEAESQRVVEQHPELLSPEADILLEQRIVAAREQGRADIERLLAERRTLLRRCRELGVEEAFAEKTELSPKQLAAVEGLAQLLIAEKAEEHYWRTGDRAALDLAVAAWERMLNHPAFALASGGIKLATLNTGNAFFQRYLARGGLEDLNRALTRSA